VTTGEILNLVDDLVKNSLSNEKKVIFLNLAQTELYKDYPLPEKMGRFNTVVGQSFYDLPDDCPEDRILWVTLDGKKYEYQSPEEEYQDEKRFWAIAIGELFISEPDSVVEGVIYYRPSPTALSASSLTAAPDFPPDLHELLALGGAIRVAEATKQYEKKQSLKGDYLELKDGSVKRIKKRAPHRVTVGRYM